MSAADVAKPIVLTMTMQSEQSGGSSVVVNSTTPKAKTQSTGSSITNAEKFENTVSGKGKLPPKSPEDFYKELQQFHERRATPLANTPKISGREIDLYKLYNEVTERGGFQKVNQRDEWDEVLPDLGLRDKCVNATAALKLIYRRCLEKYERLHFFGEDPDKMEALEASDLLDTGGRSRTRYPSALAHQNASGVNSVAMSYNYRQHIVNMERRRMYKLSTDLHKPSPYEKLMLSLISPLPNEQDFAINVCTIMANESKQASLKLQEFPKLLDVLLAHAGVFSDGTLRSLFHQVYTKIRRHSLFSFWRDLLYDKPQIMELYAKVEEPSLRDLAQIYDEDENMEYQMDATHIDDFSTLGIEVLNIGRSEGIQDWVGQRVQQILGIFRNLSFFEDNLKIFAKNRTFLRFIVMSANVRWGNVHIQALDIAGNVASELELLDPTLDELSRSLMATLCDGIEGMDRAIIINSLEILYKLCQRDSNEEHIHKCLNLKFYQTICLFLSLNDIMLLIFTLEAIYALTSLGTRHCHLFMQVRGLVDQLVSLITVEAQSYGPDGCILMRVVETVPGNMLPMVAQNIANLQNVAVIQKQQQHPIIQHSTSVPAHLQQQQQPTMPQLAVNVDPNALVVNEVQPSVPQPQTILQHPQQQPQQVTHPLPPSSPQSFTYEDEQYALAWLGATFERTAAVESHVEQQELYRMYLSHCQKAGKLSVVNHMQFPRMVRLIFGNAVGPVVVRRRVDGTELPGLHYISIRLRAQPLPIQIKCGQQSPPISKGFDAKIIKVESQNPAKKMKKQLRPEAEMGIASGTIVKQEASTNSTASTMTTTTNALQVAVSEAVKSESTNSGVGVIQTTKTVDEKVIVTSSQDNRSIMSRIDDNPKIVCIKTTLPSPSPTPPPAAITQQSSISFESVQTTLHHHQQQQQAQQPTSSLIKSLLANKVTQRQLKQKELTAANVVQTITQTNVLAGNGSSIQIQNPGHQPIKVTSNAISALVNNPLMQNTPVKVGQTTIKPLNAQAAFEKKQMSESTPPPLAPLSGANVAKDACGRPVIIANQMLVEILDKKTGEPPIPATIIKRKIDDSAGGPGSVSLSEAAKRIALEMDVGSKEEVQVTPSKNAANLYAEMAASILEDEDLDDIPPMANQSGTVGTLIEQQQQQQSSSLIIPAKIQQNPIHNVQRQLVFQSSQSPQLKLTQSSGGHMPTAMATIKTDQGLQTVPVILQQKSLDQGQQTQIIQQVIQQTAPSPQQQTQYVLATNPQGQTYLVAQQSQTPPPPPQPTQTVLVTQSPQQTAQGTKTIIILQQQTVPTSNNQPTQLITTTNCGVTQKMIMTTPQGQQVLVTQRPQSTLATQSQQQIFINPQTGAATHIQHLPASLNSSLISQQSGANILQRQLIQTTPHVVTQTQSHTPSGQISPSLLSQLNHIPATIKLHQPQVSQPMTQHHQQGTTITSRLGKSVSIVQQTPVLPPPPPPPPMQIPQLQQHQSIIQQHIVSGPAEKRQVLLGGRPVEIKETTVITQAQPQPQPQSQAILTKQPVQSMQQQMTHASLIQQQKINVPMQQQTIMMATQKQIGGKPITIAQTIMPQPALSTTQSVLTTGKKTLPVTTTTVMKTHQTSADNPTQGTASLATKQSVITSSLSSTSTPSQSTTYTHTTQAMTSTIISGGASITSAASVQQRNQLQQQQSSQQDAIVKMPIKNNESKLQGNVASNVGGTATTATTTTSQQQQPQQHLQTQSQPQPQQQTQTQSSLPPVDPNWLYVCDWRNCPRRKYKSMKDLMHHACSVHCPDHLDPAADIFCQWGLGPGLCDGIPRKRYSLMTHLIDRHINPDCLRASMQRRIATGTANLQPTQPPVTIVRHNIEQGQRSNTASPAPSNTSSTGSLSTTGSSAMQAIKRHSADFMNAKELLDENEGPVTKSIRLTASLILRNLVTYTTTAKRNLRQYEPHLANIALSNVESSSTIAHILSEMNS